MQRVYGRLSMPADLVVLIGALLILTSTLLPWALIPERGAPPKIINAFDQGGGTSSGVVMAEAAACLVLSLILLMSVCHQKRLLTLLAVASLCCSSTIVLLLGFTLLSYFHKMAADGLGTMVGKGLYLLVGGGVTALAGSLLELTRARNLPPEASQ